MPKKKQIKEDDLRPGKVYTGYFNYRIVEDKLRNLKTHYFKEIPWPLVTKLRIQFHSAAYIWHGENIKEISIEKQSTERM